MKYIAPLSLMIFGNEILSLIALCIVAVIFCADILKGDGWRA